MGTKIINTTENIACCPKTTYVPIESCVPLNLVQTITANTEVFNSRSIYQSLVRITVFIDDTTTAPTTVTLAGQEILPFLQVTVYPGNSFTYFGRLNGVSVSVPLNNILNGQVCITIYEEVWLSPI